MRGLADKRNASFRELPGALDRQRKQMAPRFDVKTDQDGVRLALRRLRQFLGAQRPQPLGLLWRRYPHDAGAVAGQRHKYARPLRRMKFRRDIAMRTRMADVERQCRLIEFAAVDGDAGGLPA